MNYTFIRDRKPAAQAAELDKLNSPNSDRFLLKLGQYIADGINPHYLSYNHSEIAIREIIDYDAVNIDISRFPLLKLYRQTDQYDRMGELETKAVIAYCLTYPQQDKLPGLMQYMSKAIDIMLCSYYHQHQHCSQNIVPETRNAEYRIMVSEATRDIYPFLRFNFTFREQ